MHASPHASAESWHYQIEAMKLAFADAYRYVADPRRADVPVSGMLDAGYLASRRALIAERARDHGPGQPPGGGTVYLCAADRDGMMVSYIQSNYMGFGSRRGGPGDRNRTAEPGRGLHARARDIATRRRGRQAAPAHHHPRLPHPRRRPGGSVRGDAGRRDAAAGPSPGGVLHGRPRAQSAERAGRPALAGDAGRGGAGAGGPAPTWPTGSGATAIGSTLPPTASISGAARSSAASIRGCTRGAPSRVPTGWWRHGERAGATRRRSRGRVTCRHCVPQARIRRVSRIRRSCRVPAGPTRATAGGSVRGTPVNLGSKGGQDRSTARTPLPRGSRRSPPAVCDRGLARSWPRLLPKRQIGGAGPLRADTNDSRAYMLHDQIAQMPVGVCTHARSARPATQTWHSSRRCEWSPSVGSLRRRCPRRPSPGRIETHPCVRSGRGVREALRTLTLDELGHRRSMAPTAVTVRVLCRSRERAESEQRKCHDPPSCRACPDVPVRAGIHPRASLRAFHCSLPLQSPCRPQSLGLGM